MVGKKNGYTFKSKTSKVVIMPKATAMWLIDNTSLTFKQIGDFCNMSEIEVKLMADNVIAKNVIGVDPTKNGNLTKEEIEAREKDGKPLTNKFTSIDNVNVKIPKAKQYISILQRKSRPDAVLWLVSFYPNLSDSQIVKLVHTTKNMVSSIRSKTYSKYNELTAKDPVAFGFCTQIELNKMIAEAENQQQNFEEKKEKQKNTTKKATSKQIRKINVNKVKIPQDQKIQKQKKHTTKKISKKYQ